MKCVVFKIYSLFNREEKWKFFLLLSAMFFVGIIEAAGIASIMPFMAVVANPQAVHTNKFLQYVYHRLGFSTVNEFLVLLGFSIFFVILISNASKAFVLRLELRFVHMRLYHLSRRLFYSYLTQPYVYFINQNTSIMGKNILQEVSKFTH